MLSNHVFDIFAINESKIDPSIPDSEINIPSYKSIRKDRNRNGGGVVIYVREQISFRDRNDLVSDSLEMICIEIERPHSKPFLLSAWYRPPNSELNIINEYELFLFKCDSESKEMIIMGDLNCDFAKSPPDTYTNRIIFLNNLYQMVNLINEPTRVTETSASTIDLILSNTPENIVSSGVSHVGISDHSLIYAVRKFVFPKSKSIMREVRDFKHFSDRDFYHDLSQVPWEIITTFSDPNECWCVWKSFFTEILDAHAPLRYKRTKANAVPWMTTIIKNEIRNRDYHKKKAIKHNSKYHWEMYKKSRNKVNINIRKTKSEYFVNKIRDCANVKDPKKSWSLINSLLGKNSKSTHINELKLNNNIITDSTLIAESLNNYFINIGPQLASDISFYEEPDNDLNNENVSGARLSQNTSFHFSQIEIHNVYSILDNLKANKSTGLDKIPAKILKLSAEIIAPSLTYIFNLSLASGIYINEWKRARVTPIYKSEDKTKCENYRPISILPVISKVFEKEIFRQLYGYLTDNDLLSKHQSGFRPKHSTLSALIQMCDDWLSNMDVGKINCVVFLDIRKAFDSINHEILLKKMNLNFGISGNALKWFDSYIKDREQRCIVNGQLSSSKKIICRVPQGSILDPLLFLLYINDMPDSLNNTTASLYADDTEIYASSDNSSDLISKLNEDFKNMSRWMSINKLQIHPTKSKYMFIGSSHNIKNNICNEPILINSIPVPRVTNYKCLGVNLDDKLCWDSHIEMICKKVAAGIAAIKRVKPFVPPEMLKVIYNALVQPYFDYCSPLWDNCGIGLKEKLQKYQNRAARILTGATYDIRTADVFETLAWETLEKRRDYLKSIFMYKILNNLAAPNLNRMFYKMSNCPISYNLRNSDTDLVLPQPKTEFKKRSFSYNGALFWNNLCVEAKKANTLTSFKGLI